MLKVSQILFVCLFALFFIGGGELASAAEPFGERFCADQIAFRKALHLENDKKDSNLGFLYGELYERLALRKGHRDLAVLQVHFLEQQHNFIFDLLSEVEDGLPDPDYGDIEEANTPENIQFITELINAEVKRSVDDKVEKLGDHFPKVVDLGGLYIVTANVNLQLYLAWYMTFYWTGMVELAERPIQRPYFTELQEQELAGQWAALKVREFAAENNRSVDPMADENQPKRDGVPNIVTFAETLAGRGGAIDLRTFYVTQNRWNADLRTKLELFSVNQKLPSQSREFIRVYRDFLTQTGLPIHVYGRALIDNYIDHLKMLENPLPPPN